MNTLTVQRQNGFADVPCRDCGGTSRITDRQHRRNLQEGRVYRCRLCRATQVKKPSQSDFNYWTSRYTIAELLVIGEVFLP